VSGSLELDGRSIPIAAPKRGRRDQRRVQYVPQDPLSTLNPCRTVNATIQRPMRRRRTLAPEQIERRTRELLDQIGLDASFAERYPHELSGGQRQRVAIARALAAEPEVMVCDEITSALDARTAASIMAVLDQAVTESGLTLVLVSHELEEIRRHSDVVYVIADGRVAESGPTEKVFDAPTSVEARELLA
jgi:peptide/nickel transport system ATP-binding protein